MIDNTHMAHWIDNLSFGGLFGMTTTAMDDTPTKSKKKKKATAANKDKD